MLIHVSGGWDDEFKMHVFVVTFWKTKPLRKRAGANSPPYCMAYWWGTGTLRGVFKSSGVERFARFFLNGVRNLPGSGWNVPKGSKATTGGAIFLED